MTQVQLRQGEVDVSTRCVVMGILNVTPDSFSDGGAHVDAEAAVDHGLRLAADGADIIDIGPESTRPGSLPVDDREQIRRAVGVIAGIRAADDSITISIDTRSAVVAKAALDAGADIVNDTAAMRDDPDLLAVVADAGVSVVLMHRKGVPTDMQRDGGPIYDDVIAELIAFFREREAFAVSGGVARSRIVFDPGIGFGKRVEDNLRILHELPRLAALGRPILVGASRKRFLGSVLERSVGRPTSPDQRDPASIGCAVQAFGRGASIVRVHDVRGTVEALRVVEAVDRQTATDGCVV